LPLVPQAATRIMAPLISWTPNLFDLTFPQPISLLLSSSCSNYPVNSLSVRSTINSFADQCKFHLFVPIFRTGYVGTADRNDSASLQATVQALKKLAMSSWHPTPGHWLNITPDNLFANYSDLTPLLPANISLWGLNLVTQYHNGLSTDLQDLILLDLNYTPPNLSTLTSRSQTRLQHSSSPHHLPRSET
jgi:hypothetical protein